MYEREGQLQIGFVHTSSDGPVTYGGTRSKYRVVSTCVEVNRRFSGKSQRRSTCLHLRGGEPLDGWNRTTRTIVVPTRVGVNRSHSFSRLPTFRVVPTPVGVNASSTPEACGGRVVPTLWGAFQSTMLSASDDCLGGPRSRQATTFFQSAHPRCRSPLTAEGSSKVEVCAGSEEVLF